MRPMVIEAGELLYREGDPSDALYLIEEGRLEVLRRAAGTDIPLAHLGRGQIVGEMGVIRRMPRSTTVRAVHPTRLFAIDDTTLRMAFGPDNDLGMQILRMLCERLSRASAQITADEPEYTLAVAADASAIRLLPATTETRMMIGIAGVAITHLPYTVGGSARRAAIGATLDLVLDETRGSLLSEVHFRLEIDGDGFLSVRDLDSGLGCHVNGRRLSSFERFEEEPVARLVWGINELSAGGMYSPFRFKVKVDRTS